jgi:hypothetical protein
LQRTNKTLIIMMIALITEITRVLEVKRSSSSVWILQIPAPRVSRNPLEGHLNFFGDCNVPQPRPQENKRMIQGVI